MSAADARELGVVDVAVENDSTLSTAASGARTNRGDERRKGGSSSSSSSSSAGMYDSVLSAALALVEARAQTAGETLRLLKCMTSATTIRILASEEHELAKFSRSFL